MALEGGRKEGWRRALGEQDGEVLHEYGARALISSGLWLTGKA